MPISPDSSHGLSSIAKRIRSVGVSKLGPEDRYADSTFAEAWRVDGKEERYALTAIISDEVIRTSQVNRNNCPPFGIPVDVSKERLEGAFRKTLGVAISQTVQKLYDGECDDPMVLAAYDRLLEWAKFHMDNYVQITNDISPEDFVASYVMSGVNTALSVMGNALIGISVHRIRESKTPPGTHEIASIAERSYPFIAKVAMLNVETFEKMGFSRGIGIDHMELVGEADSRRLDFTDKVKKAIASVHPPQSQTFGCPAMVNFGDGPGIKDLWKWHIEAYEYFDNPLVLLPSHEFRTI